MENAALTSAKYLSEFEQIRLEEILQKYKDTDPRDSTLLWLMWKTGARPQEVLNLTWGDFNKDERTVFIRTLKGGKNREIPLQKWLFDRVFALYSGPATGPDQQARIFKMCYENFRKIWNNYRPVNKKLHALRHTFAVTLYRRSDFNLRLVQLALGHRNMTTTAIYLEIEMSKQDLVKALR